MVNTLVYHKKFSDWGICCIAKELKNHYVVNVGTRDARKVLKSAVNVIDTTNCKTVTMNQFRNRILMADHNNKLNFCIVGNEVKEFVGIGWVTLRVVTEDDLNKLPRVVE